MQDMTTDAMMTNHRLYPVYFIPLTTAAPQSEEERRALLAELHTLKTDIFMAMVEAGRMPLRPGVHRLISAHSI